MESVIAEVSTPAVAGWASATRGLATAVFSVALVLFLVTSGVRWVTLGEGFYLDEFARYHVGQVTGLSNAELARVAHTFVTYFQSSSGPLDMTVQLPQGPTPLLNDREIAHMEDVQALMQKVFRIWGLSGIALLVSGVSIVAVDRASGGRAILVACAIGGGLAILTIGVLGIASIVDFDQLFLQFHMISFTNDFWLLDPTRDRLIQLYPEGFFYDAALRIALETVLGGAVLLASALVGIRLIDR